ncbi:MAG: lytic transglycosylase domain-containing protein, partial [Thiothrix sp.]
MNPLQEQEARQQLEQNQWAHDYRKYQASESVFDRERGKAAQLYEQALLLDQSGNHDQAAELIAQADQMTGGYFGNLASGKYSKFAQIAAEVKMGKRSQNDPMYKEMLQSVMRPTLHMSGRAGKYSVAGLDDIGNGQYAVRLKKEMGGAFADTIRLAAARFGVDADLIAALIKQESAGKRNATSHKGAGGLMQIMLSTYAEIERELGLKGSRYDPTNNIIAGTYYLSKLLKRFNNNIPLALAAYNAGEGAVKKHGGIPPYKETQQYVPKILSNYRELKQSYPATRNRSSDNSDPVSLVSEQQLAELVSAENNMLSQISPELRQRLAQYGALPRPQQQ